PVSMLFETGDYGTGLTEEQVNLFTILDQPGVREFLDKHRFLLGFAPGINNSCLYESIFYGIYGEIPNAIILAIRKHLSEARLGTLDQMITLDSPEWNAVSAYLNKTEKLNLTLVIYSGNESFHVHRINIGQGGDEIYILHYGSHFSPLVRQSTVKDVKS